MGVFGWTVVGVLIAALTAGVTILIYLQGRPKPAGGGVRVLPWRRGAAAQRVGVRWQTESPQAAVVDNGSGATIKGGIMTVTCNQRSMDAQREFGPLPTLKSKSFEWPSGEMHQEIDARARGREPEAGRVNDDTKFHRVEATFGLGRQFWHKDGLDESCKRVSSLVIWAECTRADTLERYFGRRSAFYKEYRIKVEVKPFPKIQDVENAFTQLACCDELPEGHQVRPDIVVGPHDWIGRIAEEQWVTVALPIAGTGKQYGFNENAIGALRHQGQLCALPYVFDSVALIRNDTRTGPGDMPTTIDVLLASWQDDVRAGRLVLALQAGPYHLWPLFTSVGGSFFGIGTQVTPRGVQPVELPGGKDACRAGFIDAFAQVAALGRSGSGVLRPGMRRDPGSDPGKEPGALGEFLAGRAPYLICSSRALKSIKERGMKVTVGPVPRLGPHHPQPLVSVYGFYIYRGAPNLPAARDLLLSYLRNTKAGLDLNKIQPLVPVQEDAMKRLGGQDLAHPGDLDPLLAPYIKQCKEGMIMPTYPEMREAWQILRKAQYKALAGEDDPRKIAEKAFDKGREILEGARSTQ